MATTLRIGGQIYFPGQALSLAQMTAIQLSIQLGNDTYSGAAPGTLEAQAYAQFVAQGGQQFIANAIAAGALPRIGAGDIVSNANLAQDNNASAQRPSVGQEVLTPDRRIDPVRSESGTNAKPTPTTANTPTTGTNAATVPTSQSQAINNLSNRSTAGAGQSTADFASRDPRRTDLGGPGAAARGDDSPSVNRTNAVRNRLDELYGGAGNGIRSQDNILDQYASYTYSLSWYLMNPQTYNQTIKSSKKDLNGFYLLAQSGGASTAQGTVSRDAVQDAFDAPQLANTVIGAGRSPFFNLDYYIDTLVIDEILSGGPDSKGAATTTELSFTVTEPNGISLFPNLFAACQNLYQTTGQIGQSTRPNYAAATYCMAIRFYGYDENGQLVMPIAGSTPGTDKTAAVEKFVFFIISDIKFSVANRLVEYKITGKTSGSATGQSSNRGAVPAPFNFSGTTVKDILVGSVVQQTASQTAGDKTRNGKPIKADPPVSPNAGRAVVDDNGSFTGETDSPFMVGA